MQDMIQKMFGFLPNSETQTSTVGGDDRDPVYDTPPRAPRPIVVADNPPTSTQSAAATSASSVQTSTRPIPVARVRSSRNTYVVVVIG